ncbi:hypothetical protein A2333_00570 [Candidatus Wolfebacteria bacterium RIFOXYB2_FULL_49_7]|uniref:NERD domain-containing protein n=1 Tax=Candidatus Wolfebacteria bacterium RIFOXYB1_FULL_54_12 TaxID=1802559 RepID=A0A1F8DWJ8_9BACT|nr:MAG: hypothetical protein A2333_00570 [Candidatus Wolfebacteria bacterium RIFOXYB2_FULL_49_7]OGM92947.1 MAG: hypothetical protein A2372_03820 [Candidatus Wolfebacteria bacterium RIFOXYB1_FULL_54_12]
MSHNEWQIVKNIGKAGLLVVLIGASIAQPLYLLLGGSGAALAVHLIVIGILLKLLWSVFRDIRVRTQGAGGEACVRVALKGLDDRFRVLESVVIGNKGDIDFVVVGPTGVWVIEVKSHKGRIRIEGGRLLRNEKPFDKNFIRQVWGATYALKDALKRRMPKQLHMQPVVAFSSKHARVGVDLQKIDNAYVVGVDRLIRLIERQEVQRLTADEVERIFDAIRNAIRGN